MVGKFAFEAPVVFNPSVAIIVASHIGGNQMAPLFDADQSVAVSKIVFSAAVYSEFTVFGSPADDFNRPVITGSEFYNDVFRSKSRPGGGFVALARVSRDLLKLASR